MAGNATFPALGSSNTVNGGKDDDVRSVIGSKISAAKFVDNTIHHATYERGTDSITGRYMSVGRPTTSDFQTTPEHTYNIVEEESTLLLTHTPRTGVKRDVAPFFADTRLKTGDTPPLLLMTTSGRLLPDSVSTANKGVRLDFRNLKGLSPSGVSSEFITGAQVHAGQIVNVGMRTSDLVMRLFKGKTHGLNSVGVGRPFAGPRTEEVNTYKGANLARHSGRFLSHNFISTSIPEATRYVGRHDNYYLHYDRYGNFIYAPDGFSNVDKQIDPLISANVESDSVVDVANEVIVKGKKMADNDNNRATVKDVEMQKRDGIVKTMRVFDPVATTLTAARRSANQFLRLNRKAQGVVKSKRHQMAWELYPSDVINYRSPIDGGVTRKAVLEVEHNLQTMSSDFQLISYEVGIERVMQEHGSLLEDIGGTVSNDKVKRLDMGGGDRALLRIRGAFYVRHILGRLNRSNSTVDYTLLNSGNDIHSGFLIGHRDYDTGDGAGRAALGTGLTPRLTGGSFAGSTLTVSSTSGFPDSGHLTINDAIHVLYTGKTSTTFTGVAVQAPSGASIPASGLTVRLLRSKSHEMRTVKGLTIRRRL